MRSVPAQAEEVGGEEAARERPRGVMTLDELQAYAEETGDPLAHRPVPGVRYTYVLDQDEGAQSPKDGHRYVPPRSIAVEGERGRVEDAARGVAWMLRRLGWTSRMIVEGCVLRDAPARKGD